MTQFFPPAVNVGDAQSLNIEANANSEVTSLVEDDMNTTSEACGQVWTQNLDCDLLIAEGLLLSFGPLLCSIGSIVPIS